VEEGEEGEGVGVEKGVSMESLVTVLTNGRPGLWTDKYRQIMMDFEST